MATNLISSLQYTANGDISVFTTPYGECSTAAGTAAKTVDAIGDFALATGARILVKFTVTNTANNPTLNVDGSGAKYFAEKYIDMEVERGRWPKHLTKLSYIFEKSTIRRFIKVTLFLIGNFLK